MNTIKFARAALAVGILLTLAAIPNGWAEGGRSATPPTPDEQRAHLSQMRDIMHSAAFTAKVTQTGVTVTVASPDATRAAAIRTEFGERHELQSPIAGSAVSAAPLEGGVALAFTSEDAAIVQALQAAGTGLAYAMLRNDMHAVQWSTPGQAGPGPGGWDMMGPGPSSGYGPGMGYGWMHGGRGMMGYGYGPGWMHRGWWNAPQDPSEQDKAP